MGGRVPGGRPASLVVACACMLPGTVAWSAALVGLAATGFGDPDLVLRVTLPVLAVCLLMVALHALGIVGAWRGTSALLRVPAWITVALVTLFALLAGWTAVGGNSANLEPTMLVLAAPAALAGAALLLLRTTPARAWLPASGPADAVSGDLRPLVTIAAVLSGSYAVYVLLNLTRPRMAATDPALSLFADPALAVGRAVLWGVLASWLVVLVVLLVAAARRALTASRPEARSRVLLVVVAVLLLPFLALPLATLTAHPALVLVCAPSTAFGLWTVRRAQRFRRLPVPLLLGAAAWGALVAAGYAAAVNGLLLDSVFAALFRGDSDLLRVTRGALTAVAVNAGVVEELSKGAGVAMVLVALRGRVDGVVAGVVLGGAVGLGFNLSETVEYMALGGGATAEYQYWMRQSVGLFGAHTAYSAVVGGALGTAGLLRSPRLRRLAIACGFVAAVGGHIGANLLAGWYAQSKQELFAPSEALDILVLQPLALVLIQGPLVLLAVLLVRRGLRAEATGLDAALRAEAASGLGAVDPPEVPVLLDPVQRFGLGVVVGRRHGLAAARRLRAVQAAQLELAEHRWRATRRAADQGAETALRDRVLRLKGTAPDGTAAPAHPTGSPA